MRQMQVILHKKNDAVSIKTDYWEQFSLLMDFAKDGMEAYEAKMTEESKGKIMHQQIQSMKAGIEAIKNFAFDSNGHKRYGKINIDF